MIFLALAFYLNYKPTPVTSAFIISNVSVYPTESYNITGDITGGGHSNLTFVSNGFIRAVLDVAVGQAIVGTATEYTPGQNVTNVIGSTNTEPFYSNQRAICRDNVDIVHAVWLKNSSDIVYARSVNGTYWDVNESFSVGGFKHTPHISCSGTNITVAFVEGNNVKIAISIDNGNNWRWLAPPTASCAQDFAFAEKNKDFIYVIFEAVQTSGCGYGDIKLLRSVNDGLSWEAPRVIFDGYKNSGTDFWFYYDPSLVIDYESLPNRIYTLARGMGWRSQSIEYSNSSYDLGGTWSSPTAIVVNSFIGGYSPYYPSMTLNRSKIFISHFGISGTNYIALNRSDDYGATWYSYLVNSVPIFMLSPLAEYPSVTTNSLGYPIVFWQQSYRNNTDNSAACINSGGTLSNCNNAFDENYDTYASCSIDGGTGVCGSILENYTISNVQSTYNWTFSFNTNGSRAFTNYYWDYMSSSWQQLYTSTSGAGSVTIIIPSSGIQNNLIMINTTLFRDTSGSAYYYEGGIDSSKNIFYRNYNGTGWDDVALMTNDSSDNRFVNTVYQGPQGCMEFVYRSGLSPPYNIVFQRNCTSQETSPTSYKICFGFFCLFDVSKTIYSMNFTGKLNYSNGSAVSDVPVKVIINYYDGIMNHQFYNFGWTNSTGNFIVKIDNLPDYIVGKDLDISIDVQGNIEAVYTCWYNHTSTNCCKQPFTGAC